MNENQIDQKIEQKFDNISLGLWLSKKLSSHEIENLSKLNAYLNENLLIKIEVIVFYSHSLDTSSFKRQHENLRFIRTQKTNSLLKRVISLSEFARGDYLIYCSEHLDLDLNDVFLLAASIHNPISLFASLKPIKLYGKNPFKIEMLRYQHYLNTGPSRFDLISFRKSTLRSSFKELTFNERKRLLVSENKYYDFFNLYTYEVSDLLNKEIIMSSDAQSVFHVDDLNIDWFKSYNILTALFKASFRNRKVLSALTTRRLTLPAMQLSILFFLIYLCLENPNAFYLLLIPLAFNFGFFFNSWPRKFWQKPISFIARFFVILFI